MFGVDSLSRGRRRQVMIRDRPPMVVRDNGVVVEDNEDDGVCLLFGDDNGPRERR